jgi:hypothetical protein
VSSKPVVPRELANRDVENAIEYYLSENAEQAGFVSLMLWKKPTPISVATLRPVHLVTHMNSIFQD